MKERRQKADNQEGFSLTEVIVALAILTLILTSGLAAMSSNLRTAVFFQNELIAIHLAQEGIEVSRNIRDNAWHNNSPCFEDALPQGSHRLVWDSIVFLPEAGNPFLKKDSNGFYNYISGNSSIFKRRIFITDSGGGLSPCDAFQKKIVTEVTWDYKGASKAFTLEEYLYDWK